jgi:NADH-quinone oxidoreductase subunit J
VDSILNILNGLLTYNCVFYVFALLTLASAILVVTSRNPVTSAMFLVLTMIGISGLFVLLNAYFLAAVQILVYAGAVMVLFLFVIMLLNLGEEEQRMWNKFAIVTGGAAFAGLSALLLMTIWGSNLTTSATAAVGSTRALGTLLFTEGRFLLPFEIVSLLLLSAMMGVILLSKKELK